MALCMLSSLKFLARRLSVFGLLFWMVVRGRTLSYDGSLLKKSVHSSTSLIVLVVDFEEAFILKRVKIEERQHVAPEMLWIMTFFATKTGREFDLAIRELV